MATLKHSLCCLLVAAVVTVQGAASAEEPDDNEACLIALRALEDAPPVELHGDVGLLTAIVLSTDSRSSFRGGGRYVQREERTYKGGRTIVFRNSFVCEGGAIALIGRSSQDANEPSETFDPPLPWLPIPPGSKSSWAYSGIHTTEIFGETAKLPAKGSGYVSGAANVTTASGQVDAVHVHWALRIGRTEKRDLAEDHWFRMGAFPEEVKRKIVDSDAGTRELSLGGEADSGDGPGAGQDKKIIIILDPNAPGNELNK